MGYWMKSERDSEYSGKNSGILRNTAFRMETDQECGERKAEEGWERLEVRVQRHTVGGTANCGHMRGMGFYDL